MEKKDIYERIREEQLGPASYMVMSVYDEIENYQFEQLQASFSALPYIEDATFEEVEKVLQVRFFVDDQIYTGGFMYEPYEDDEFKKYIFGISSYAHLPKNGLPKLCEATGNITFSLNFHENVREDYLMQLRILTGLSSHIACIYDESAYRVLPMEQITYLLSMKTLPSYDLLYCVHGVYDENGTYWLHTHGLSRCGLIELELIKIKENIHEFSELLNATAKRYLEDGLPEQDAHINVGYASMVTLEVKWTPWEKALEQETKRHLFQKKADFCGSFKDREDEHSMPSGILYAYYEQTYQPIHVYTSFLSDNPILYISNEETKRMADYAKEAIAHLRNIFEKNEEEKEDMLCMIKAGIDVDVADELCGDKEHLWFEVTEIKERSFIGELTNEPYGVSYMNCGESYEIDLEKISDYMIMRKEQVTLTPNNMYLYYMEHPMN